MDRTRLAATAIAVAAFLGVAACGVPDLRVDAPATTVPAVVAASASRSAETSATPSNRAVGVTAAARATTPAVRIDPPPRDDCERIARRIGAIRREATQLVVVQSASWTSSAATLQLAERVDGRWECDGARDARLGRTGTRPLLDRRSGDGTTPAGVFPLATMTAWDGQRFSFFGNDPDPGVRAGTYRRVRTGDCFGATPNTPGYGHLRNDTACAGADDEYLPRFVQAYTHAALIGANMEPDVSGDEPGEIPYAAAIFLHRHVYDIAGATRPTSGCVSIGQDDLVEVLRRLRSDAVFVIGPTDWLSTTSF